MHAFISYSWDNDAHKDWVREFADNLLENGVDVTLDQYDLGLGQDRFLFMEKSVSGANAVLCICTPAYVTRANEREKGVGVETTLITPQFYHANNDKQFIPIIRYRGEGLGATPDYMDGLVYLDFCEDSEYDTRMDELLRHLHGEPEHVKPKVGEKPTFEPIPNEPNLETTLTQILGEHAGKLLNGEAKQIGVMLNQLTLQELDRFVSNGDITLISTGSMMNMGAGNSIGGHIEELKRPYGFGQGFILTIAK